MLVNILFIALRVLSQFTFSAAYSWKLNAAPKQCSNISISVTESDGLPPYNVLVVPFGPTPFQNKIDVRGVIYKPFNGRSIDFPINYPADTQFVAVVSDASGFGTGGTSKPTSVAQSGDTSCFNASEPWRPYYWFYIGPAYIQGAHVVQCNTTRLWWNHTAIVEGTPSFVGVIPGGRSISILPSSAITNTTDEGYGFPWLPTIREGTQIVFVSGDDRGLGAGGSAQTIIEHSEDATCVPPASPPGTTGSPAGAVDSGPRRNVPAIIGGAIGGVIGFMALLAIATFIFFLHRRNTEASQASEKSILGSDTVSNMTGQPSSQNDILRSYNAEPFVAANNFSGGYALSEDAGRPELQRVLTPLRRGGFAGGGKNYPHWPGLVPSGSGTIYSTSSSSADPQAVNVVQHTDSGETSPGGVLVTKTTTINLPPRYDTLGGAQNGSGADRKGF